MDLGDELYARPDAEGAAELFDCVGSDFPNAAIVATAASPHFVRPPRQIVHGLGVSFTDTTAAHDAEQILSAEPFAECLGRAIAADFESQDLATEMLAVDVAGSGDGLNLGHGHTHRVTFTGGDQHGVQPVHLDIVILHVRATVAVLWFGDTPNPFDEADARSILDAINSRAG